MELQVSFSSRYMSMGLAKALLYSGLCFYLVSCGEVENAGPALIKSYSVSFVPIDGVDLTKSCIADICEDALGESDQQNPILVASNDRLSFDYKVQGVYKNGEVFEFTGNLASELDDFAESIKPDNAGPLTVFVTGEGVVSEKPR